MRKPTLALVRRSERDVTHLPAWFSAAGLEVADVRRWEDVQIFEVSNAGRVRVYLNGACLDGYDLVYWAGAPGALDGVGAGGVGSGREGWYCNAERTAALLAALSGARGPRLINPGETLLWGRLLSDPRTTLRRLAACGWKTPSLTTAFDLGAEPIGPSPWSLPPGERSVQPTPESRRLAIFTRTGAPFMADRPDEDAPPAILAMSPATQVMLRALGWDWATIAVGFVGDEGWAHGVRPELPRSLATDAAVRVIRGLIAGPLSSETAAAPIREQAFA